MYRVKMDGQSEERLAACLSFLAEIGLTVVERSVPDGSFLPGIEIQNGTIWIDRARLQYPGDILHEAGHLAVTPADKRAQLCADQIGKDPGHEAEEMMAIAWSYAACLHLGIDPSFVLHEGGYKGGANSIAENFANKRYFGVPSLQWLGMTYEEKNAEAHGVAPYPHMVMWLRSRNQ